MDTQDLRTLKIMQEFDVNDSPSQRYLSKQLDISLGLVNSFLKRLTKKGYFKITTIPRNRVKYILTPKGALEKSRLTYEYIHYSINFYRDARLKVKQLFKDIEAKGVTKIVFYGASDLAEIAFVSLMETSIKLIAIVDDQKKEKSFLGRQIQTTDSLNSLKFDNILITTIDLDNDPMSKLREKGIPANKIIPIQ